MALWYLTCMVIVQFIYFSTADEQADTCEKQDVCSCKFKNGSKVNLRRVDGGSKPSFVKIDGTNNRKFDWNPCTPFKTYDDTIIKKTDLCSDTMVCQVASNTDKNAGSEDNTFSVENGNVVIAYGTQVTGNDPYKRGSKITLQCDPSHPGNGTVSKFTEHPIRGKKTSIYYATFTSKFACATGGSKSGGLSPGSIILIVFFCLVLMYIIAGILINRYGRGIESMPELLPNHSFWADFPFLVKDGVVLSYGGVKSASGWLSRKCSKDSYAEI